MVQLEGSGKVKRASSAVSVTYDMALGLNIQNPHDPFRKDVLGYYIRKASAHLTEAPSLMEVTFDLGNVREYLVKRGPLSDQSFADLIDSTVMILRSFWGFRAADLVSMAHVKQSNLDGYQEDSDTVVSIWFYSLKTSQGKWTALQFTPLSRSRLRKGLQLSVSEAKARVQSCCAVRALAEIRRRMLPLLRTQQAVALKRKQIYAKHFLPWKKDDPGMGSTISATSSSVSPAVPFRFIKAGTMNGLLARHHAKMPGMPALAKGCHPRHYRHVSLSTMHFVGASASAKVLSTHAADSTVFRQSYQIADVDTGFKARYLQVHELTGFAQLTAPERLLL